MRALATLCLTFGLVSIPVKLYSTTVRATAIRFKLMSARGARMRQQYVEDEPPVDDLSPSGQEGRVEELDQPATAKIHDAEVSRSAAVRRLEPSEQLTSTEPARPTVVERNDLAKGYEFERGKFVLFSPSELKALQEAARESIDIVSFVPLAAVDPIYFDMAYLLAPDRRGERPYALLLAALRHSGRCALAKWAWRSRQYVVQVRAAEGGLVLQQLRYADEVRCVKDLEIPLVPVADMELQLALQLVEQASQPAYDPTQFVDEEKQRILAAVERKISGQEIVTTKVEPPAATGQVIDLMAALRASLRAQPASTPLVMDRGSDRKPRKPARTAAAPTSPGRRKTGGR